MGVAGTRCGCVLAERQPRTLPDVSLDLAEVVNADNVRMIQFRERAGFAGEATGKIQVAARPRRENLQSDEPVQRRLAGFIDRAHAALADEFKNFQLRKKFLQFGERRRRERRSSRRRTAFSRDAALQQASRAKSFRHVRFQFRAALRALAGNDLGGRCEGRRWVFL